MRARPRFFSRNDPDDIGLRTHAELPQYSSGAGDYCPKPSLAVAADRAPGGNWRRHEVWHDACIVM